MINKHEIVIKSKIKKKTEWTVFFEAITITAATIAINENIKRLKKKGVKIFLKHKKSNINNISAAVYSSAIKKTG